jgi:hypothetical protein
MGCLPASGGCERRRTDPFVEHLNWLEKTNYQHEACLDVLFRNSPQPEALYVDEATECRLVVERKTVVSPQDYVVRHKNDHFVAERISEGLNDLLSEGAYGMELEPGIVGRPSELEEFAQEVIKSARARFVEVQNGRVIGSQQPRRSWALYHEDPRARAFDGGPENGLRITWNMPDSLASAWEITSDILESLSELFSACVDKFQDYLNDRRIVVIDPYGDIRYNPDCWWGEVFEALPPPPSISEIWSGTYDWLDDEQQGWIFDKLYPISKEPRLKLIQQ